MRYLVCASCFPSENFDMTYLKKAFKKSHNGLMIHSNDFSIKIYNCIYIWNQQELLYKMVYKLYDLVKVDRIPPPPFLMDMVLYSTGVLWGFGFSNFLLKLPGLLKKMTFKNMKNSIRE
jgi:hypothetical protein